MKKKTKEILFAAWDWCDDNDKSTEFMLNYMADMAGVEYDTALNFVVSHDLEDRTRWREGK